MCVVCVLCTSYPCLAKMALVLDVRHVRRVRPKNKLSMVFLLSHQKREFRVRKFG